MYDPATLLGLSGAAVAGLGIASVAALKGWSGWLDFKRMEIASHRGGDPIRTPPPGRVELADLKERVRRLEAIATGAEH